MKVAAIYDIHGNLPALEAVLAEVHEEGVEKIVVGGDVVPGPMPRETMETLLALHTPVEFIVGNGENDVLAIHRGDEPTRVPEQFREAMRWTAEVLLPEHMSAMSVWPSTLAMAVPGVGEVLFCHATPRDDNELFTRLTPEDRLEPVFDGVGADLVVCGHTHMQFDRRVGDVRVINAGSTGMPFGDPGAYWVLLGPDAELRRTPYDLMEADERIRATAYPHVSGFDVVEPPPESRMLEAFEAAALASGEAS